MTENRYMRLIVHSVIFILFCFSAMSVFADEDAALEFEVKKDQNDDKVADFYTRLILLERTNSNREQGAEDMRKQRQKWAAEQIKARQEFKREKKIDSEDGLAAHEKAMAERSKLLEAARKDYVRRRDDMNRLQKRLGVIPEDIEYGIGYENN